MEPIFLYLDVNHQTLTQEVMNIGSVARLTECSVIPEFNQQSLYTSRCQSASVRGIQRSVHQFIKLMSRKPESTQFPSECPRHFTEGPLNYKHEFLENS